MVRRYRLLREEASGAHVYGATMARADVSSVVADVIQLTSTEGSLDVVLDFSGIVSATASYLKRTVLWLHDCALLAAEGRPAEEHEDAPIPLDIYPFVTGLAEEVSLELEDVLFQHNRICLEVPFDVAPEISKARLIGPLDPALRQTLVMLTRMQRATATELHQAHALDRQKITVNAWNNRLSDLFSRRLARRTKAGRHWVYEPVVPEVVIHG